MAPAARGVRFAWLGRLVGEALALYLRLVARTCRVSGEVSREQVVLVAWHEFNMASFAVVVKCRADLPHASFSTQGFRGVVMTTMIERSGVPVRVFPLPPETDRAAGSALSRRIATLARQGYSIIVTPDGPFGPYRATRPGALIVARAAGLPLLPWAFRVRPQLRIKARWDRHVVPLPFCRIRVVAGDLMPVASRQPLRPLVAELAATLAQIAGPVPQAERR